MVLVELANATDICEGNEEWLRGFSESIEGIHDELVRAIGASNV